MFRFVCAALWLAFSARGQDPSRTLLQHAVELHQKGDTEGAIAAYREFLKQRPDAYQVRSNLGAVLVQTGRYDEAIVQYRQALAAEPRNAAIGLNLALAYYKAGQINEAAREFTRLHAAQPANRQITMLDADCQLRLGNNKNVIGLLTPLQTNAEDGLAVDYMLGTALVRDQQLAKGQVIIDRILKSGDSAEARLLMGATKSYAMDFAGALEDLAQAVRLNPNLPDVYSYYGAALLTTGDQAGAAEAFRKELASNPNDFTSNLQLGALLRTDQKPGEALPYIQHALRVRPGDPGARFQLASIEIAENKLVDARLHLEGIVKDHPKFTEAHVALAGVYYRLKQRAEGDRERATVKVLQEEAQAKEPGAVAR